MKINYLYILILVSVLGLGCTRPATISHFQVTEISPCTVSVTAEVSGKVDESGVRYGIGSDLSQTLLSTSPSGSLIFLIENLQVNTEYSFCLYALNTSGESVSEIGTLTTSFWEVSEKDNIYPIY